EGGEDRAAADAHDVGEHAGELDVGRLQGLLDAQGVLGDFPHELFTRAGQVAQLLHRGGRHEAAANQTVRQQVGDPGGVVDVALAAGDVADMHGVGEDELDVALEHMPDRLPVHAARLHGHVR